MLDKDFNVPGIGKRMPYRTPDGVFDAMERNVFSAVGCKKSTHRRWCTFGLTLAAAASLAIIVVFAWDRGPSQTDSLVSVMQAFEMLDDEDRAFLSEIYDEDMFININY